MGVEIGVSRSRSRDNGKYVVCELKKSRSTVLPGSPTMKQLP
jgi:hypothetical protein